MIKEEWDREERQEAQGEEDESQGLGSDSTYFLAVWPSGNYWTYLHFLFSIYFLPSLK